MLKMREIAEVTLADLIEVQRRERTNRAGAGAAASIHLP